jgi:hypothetical protein
MKVQRIVCWFSCGAASAVATKIMLKQASKLFPDVPVVIANSPIIEEHTDNERFFNECQQWFGQEIIKLYNPQYPKGKNSIYEVFSRRNFLKGPNGAPCTTQLKRIPRGSFQEYGDLHVFGYDLTEIDRAQEFEEKNPTLQTYFPLIEAELTKADCLAMLQDANIELPAMYKLGYLNNNCIGCVKGGAGYWNKIRKDFPETFARMAKVEREIGHSILKNDDGPIYLDELKPNVGRYKDEPDIDCSFSCVMAKEDNDWHVVKFGGAA